MANTEILLEAGTNEMEIMEFLIDDELYGINVAKIKEIMRAEKVKPMPHSHEAVEGIFKPRDTMLTVVDLPFFLTRKKTEPQPKDLFVITNFNYLNMAFRVNAVEGIRRISWADIEKPDKTLSANDEGLTTGIAECEGRLVTILDFEKIVADIAPETGVRLEEVDAFEGTARSEHAIVMAEDSALLAKLIEAALVKAGYTNLIQFNNGQEAWNYLEALREGNHLSKKVDLVITDIEMPQMDGHRLTKLIKTDPVLKEIPVLIFSSLINPEMVRKGKELGADEQLSKPEIGRLVEVMDRILTRDKE